MFRMFITCSLLKKVLFITFQQLCQLCLQTALQRAQILSVVAVVVVVVFTAFAATCASFEPVAVCGWKMLISRHDASVASAHALVWCSASPQKKATFHPEVYSLSVDFFEEVHLLKIGGGMRRVKRAGIWYDLLSFGPQIDSRNNSEITVWSL